MQNLDEGLDLATLADVACRSPYPQWSLDRPIYEQLRGGVTGQVRMS